MKKLILLSGFLSLAFMVVVIPKHAHAYVINGNWGNTNLSYYVDTTNIYGLDPVGLRADINSAATNWPTQGNVPLTFTDLGTVSNVSAANDGKNIIMMRSAGSTNTAGATTYTYYSNGHIIGADIIMWENFKFLLSTATSCSGQLYVLDILTHEFGHFIGLAHSSVSSATMYYKTGYCSKSFRSLDPDDIAGVQADYSGTSSSQSATLSLSPTSLTFSADINGSLPSPQSVTFKNVGTATSNWTTSTNQSWCHVSPSSGSTGAGSTTLLSVSMTMPTTTGTFGCVVSVADSKASNSPQQVSVSFNVTGTAPSDTTPPLVKITSPTDGSNVSGRVTIQATASDNVAISKVEFYIDNKLSATDTSYPYSYKWSINKRTTSGTHSITVKAYDPSGNTASALISVVN